MFPKLKSQLPPFGLLTAGLTIITLVTALGGMWHYQYELAHQSSSIPSKNAKALDQTASVGNIKAGPPARQRDSQLVNSSSTASTTLRPRAANKSTGASPGASAPVGNQSANAASQPATISLNLSVNGRPKGLVRLSAGSNQCSVLSQALTANLISSLDMRYSSEYGTQAVYVIDGIGDPGAVWWTYKVNGTAPPYGCAYVTAHNGDSVNWQYIKS